jgi:AraC-like DNA-binding protein
VRDFEYILEKVYTIATEMKFPLIRLLNEQNKKIKQRNSEVFLNKIVGNKGWEEFIHYQESFGKSTTSPENDCFIFIGKFGLVYHYKALFIHDKFIGAILFGGFPLENINDFSFWDGIIQEDCESFLVGKALPTREISKKFLYFSTEISKILSEINPHFSNIMLTLYQRKNKRTTLKDLSEIHFLSTSHIRRLFIQNTGTSFSIFYKKWKLDLANELHEGTKLSKNEIAERLGYPENRSFIKNIGKVC